MKKLLFPLIIIVTIGCSDAQPTSQNRQISATTKVSIPRIPTSLEFASERVPLEYADVREALERELIVTSYMHTATLRTLKASKRYFAIIEPILKQYGIPEDFKYLAMAESGLNPNAVSSARAAGLWQFMQSASKDFSLETGDNVDMRFNVEKSTHAACKYLKKSYDKFGNWAMVAASYNVGPTGVTSRSSKQDVTSYYDIYLPEETMRYVFRIMSFKLIEQNPAEYGFVLEESDYQKPIVNFTTVEISDENIDWSGFAAKHNTNYKVLRILNPWIRSYVYANKGGKSYTVAVPTGKFRELGY